MQSKQRALVNTEDSVLVSTYLKGDETAFNELFLRYEKRLMFFMKRRTGDDERSKELVQDVFFRAIKHLEGFDNTRSFSAWIYTIAKNTAKNEARRKKIKPSVLFTDLGRPDEDGTPPWLEFHDPNAQTDANLELEDLRDLFVSAIHQVPKSLHETLVLRVLEGKSYEDISSLVCCNINTVKSRISRGRKIARQIVRFKHR